MTTVQTPKQKTNWLYVLLLLAILAVILVPQVKPSLLPRERLKYETKIMEIGLGAQYKMQEIQHEGWQVKAAFVRYRQSVALPGLPKMPPTQRYVLVLQRPTR